MEFADPQFRTRAIFISRAEIGTRNELVIGLGLPDCRSPKSLGINDDTRLLGLRIKRIEWETMNRKPVEDNSLWQFGRPVGWEFSQEFRSKADIRVLVALHHGSESFGYRLQRA